MTIPAAKVRTLCTGPEVELVRASRKSDLTRLSTANVERLAARARKHFDKWQGLSRDQSRKALQQPRPGDDGARTQLKTEIFRDALDRFEAQLAKRSSSAPAGETGARPRARPASTSPRAAKGKAARAAVGAKRSRLAESGKTTRGFAHVSARGKRAQARRDAQG